MLDGLPRTVWNSPFNQRRGTAFLDFNIFEEDGLFDDPIKTITGNIIDGNLVAEWTIKQEDLVLIIKERM